MSDTTEWSPDEPQGTEVFEPGDEASDDSDALDPNAADIVELDPTLDPRLLVDDRELEEADAEFDDPEKLATLPGGGDDPDGVDDLVDDGDPIAEGEEEGWDLDAGETAEADPADD
jgi:hypothetical protein